LYVKHPRQTTGFGRFGCADFAATGVSSAGRASARILARHVHALGAATPCQSPGRPGLLPGCDGDQGGSAELRPPPLSLAYHSRRGLPNVVRQVKQAQDADDQVARVELPPAEAVPGGSGEGVMVVVPSFAKGEDAEEEAVAAMVVVAIGPRAP